MAAVTFKDNYLKMTSLVTSHRWAFITRQANLIVSVTDEISVLNFYELINGGFSFCHTTISGATTNTGTSTIGYFYFLYISACRLLCDCRHVFQQWVWVVRYSVRVYNTSAHIVTEPSLFGNKTRHQTQSSRTGGFHSFPKFMSIFVYNTIAPGGVLSIFLPT